MKYPVAVFAVIIAAFWWLMMRRMPARDFTVTGGATTTPADLLKPGQAQTSSLERAMWSSALGIPIWNGMLSDVDDVAAEAGGPIDWEKRGWPTPCGPSTNVRQYCKIERLSDMYQQETGHRFPKGTY